jgi:hypothetical protein
MFSIITLLEEDFNIVIRDVQKYIVIAISTGSFATDDSSNYWRSSRIHF